MRKGAIAASFAVAAGVTVAVKRRRRKPRRVSPALILPAIIAVSATDDFWRHFGDGIEQIPDPTYAPALLNAAAGWFSNLSGLAGAVLSIIGFVTSPIVDLCQGVWDKAIDGINWAWHLTGFIKAQFESFAIQLGHLVDGLRTRVWDIVGPAVEAFFEPFVYLVGEAWNAADWLNRNVFGMIVDEATRIAHAVVDLVIGPIRAAFDAIQDFIADPIGFITNIIDDIVDGLIDVIIDILTTAAHLCAKIVELGFNFLLDIEDGAFDVLKEAWHYLVILADNPVEVLEQRARDVIEDIVQSSYKSVEDIVADNMDEAERLVKGLLGL